MEEKIQFELNGKRVEIQPGENQTLLWILRTDFNLTGTKYGCGEGYCGSCTVLMNDEPVRSCGIYAEDLEGMKIVTIEGLASTGADGSVTLHPVQQAFIDAEVPQCGWCMSGQIMTAAAYLEAQPSATEDEIVAAMGSNYCRCGCYVRILRAVTGAAEQMAGHPAEVAA